MRIKNFVITTVLATVIFCSAGFVSAQTTDNSALIAQLQAQIASLIAQIKAMQAQQGGTTQSWCHTFNTYLVAGSMDTTTSVATSGEVTQLETALTKEGLDVSGDTPGIFGDNTAAAVVQFQGKYGIKQTGTVGPLTRTKLNSLYGCGTNSNPPVPVACTPNWQCGWSDCMNGYKTQVAVDNNHCGLPSSLQAQNIVCSTLAQICAPSTKQPIITYIQALAEDKNIVHAGEKTYIYGSNLSGVTAIYIGSQIAQMDRTSTTNSNLAFYAPSNLTNGTTSVYVQTVDGKNSNSITVQTIASALIVQPTATIITATQVTNLTPYIIGTASGVSQIGVVLGDAGGKAYGSGLVPVVNGNWSVTVSPALTPGQYTIYVYDANNNQLANGSLTIVAP